MKMIVNRELLRKSDFVDLDEKFFIKTEKIIKKFEEYVRNYVYLQDYENYQDKLLSIYGNVIHSDNILYYMESLRVKHLAYLNSMVDIVAKVNSYKENFEFLSAERKFLKSKAISVIMSNQGVSASAAEKIVYEDEDYKNGHEEIRQLKEYFEYISNCYDIQQDLAKSLHQSISNIKSKL